MTHRILRDHEADRCKRSDFPIICESSLGDNPHVRMTRAGLDYESSFGNMRSIEGTIRKLKNSTPYYKRNRAHVCSFYIRGECTRGAQCPYRHEMPETGDQINIKDRHHGVNDPVKMDIMESPDDESITTLCVGGHNSRLLEQDMRDQFYPYEETVSSITNLISSWCCFSGSCYH